MQEILPGLFHWTTFHDGIGARVSSYFVEPAGIVVDPMVPEDGWDALTRHGQPDQVVLTSGTHTRHAARFARAFDATIRFPEEARDRIGGSLEGAPYTDHDEVAPGVRAIHIGILAPDEYALHIAAGAGALAVADGITHYGDALGFFGDDLLGAHPDRVKSGLKNRYRAQLERDFDALLFAHGDPIAHHGKRRLRDFVTSPVGHPEFGQAL
jgi:hypothetical protein